MQYPPSQPSFQQPNTQYPPQQPWQQPQYPLQQPPPIMPPPPRPPKKQHPWITLAVIVCVILFIGAIASATSKNTDQQNTTTQTTIDATPTDAPTDTPVPTATLDTSIPTDTPVPTQSAAETERLYKAQTKNTTVDNLDRDGNADNGMDVHFTCKILNFVKDDNGNTAGANCDNPNSYSTSVIQIAFPSNIDITRLNENDIIEVWGTDEGVFSGQNAFGGTVHEVGINARYMTDTNTGYNT